jgi:predicted DNA-binding transcriptional regulator AlpA
MTAAKTQLLENYLRPAEMAKQLGVSVRTLFRWHVHRTGPPRIVIGRQILYNVASVIAWLEAREQRLKK